MNNKTLQTKQFEKLLALLIDNELTPEQYNELLTIVDQDEAFKAQLKNQLSIDNLLQQRVESMEYTEAFIQSTISKSLITKTEKAFENEIINAITSEQSSNPKVIKLKTFKHYYLPWLVSGITMAACALLSIELLYNQPLPKYHTSTKQVVTEHQYTGVAVIANALNVTKDSPFKIGDAIKPGILFLKEGFLELEFYRGAQLKIAGPTKINIISEERIELISGKVMTDVPKVAIGFTIDTPNNEIIDLGTEIGVEVLDNGESQVHVFDGVIEVRNELGESERVEKGSSINFAKNLTTPWTNQKAELSKFSEFNDIAHLTGSALSLQHKRWLLVKENVLKEPSLVTYYDFEPKNDKPRILANLSSAGSEHHGAIVGAKWSEGPWEGKKALSFKRASDRVRVDITNKMESFTLASWVKIDSLDRRFSSLILTDGYDPGDIHWQLSNFNHNFGTIVLGLSSLTQGGKNYNYAPFYSVSDSGTWYHLAARVDNKKQTVSIFINGEKVKQTPIVIPSKYWQIGTASIGNWDSQLKEKPLRNLNGSIAEMMIFSSALTDEKIKTISLSH